MMQVVMVVHGFSGGAYGAEWIGVRDADEAWKQTGRNAGDHCNCSRVSYCPICRIVREEGACRRTPSVW